MNRSLRFILGILFIFLIVSKSDLRAQYIEGSAFSKITIDTMNIVLKNLIALRNNFVHKIEVMGLRPNLKPPGILMDNPPNYGDYNESSNMIHTGDWKTMSSEEKETFNCIADDIGNGTSGEDYFENDVHRWAFISEMGHWWRACMKQRSSSSAAEMAVSRINIAFWRENDSVYSTSMKKKFEDYLHFTPSPVPAVKNKIKFSNINTHKMSLTTYMWYRSSIIIDGFNEIPVATFKQTVYRSGNLN